jgi:hypothetical protein
LWLLLLLWLLRVRSEDAVTISGVEIKTDDDLVGVVRVGLSAWVGAGTAASQTRDRCHCARSDGFWSDAWSPSW